MDAEGASSLMVWTTDLYLVIWGRAFEKQVRSRGHKRPRAGPVDDSVENLVGNLRTQYLGSVTGGETFAADAKITGLLLQKTA